MKYVTFGIEIFILIFFGIYEPIYSSNNDETKVEKYDIFFLNENQTDLCADPFFVCQTLGPSINISDPFDCHSYFVCESDDVIEQETCPESCYLDSSYGECTPMNSSDSCSKPCDCEYGDEDEDNEDDDENEDNEDEDDVNEDVCDPYDSCTNLSEYCLVPNPQNCHSYFVCSSFSENATEKYCQEGYGFDINKHYCTNEQSNCSKPCSCNYDDYNLNVCDPTKSCELLGPGCLVANPRDLQKYYKCGLDDGEVELDSKECSENLYFNSVKRYCSNIAGNNQLCNCSYDTNPDYCDPLRYCENLEDYCLVPDPDDGRKYYTCQSFRNSTYFERLDCSPGFYFDFEEHYCTDDQQEYDKPCHCDYDLFKLNPCDPSRACQILGSGCLVPDPYNCHNYYSCSSFLTDQLDIQINSTACPDGFYFNAEKHYCTLEATHCIAPCSCDYEFEDSCDPISTCQGLNDRCLIPDPDDCHYYFECASFNHNFEDLDSEKFQCQDGQYFDSTLHFCTKGPTNCTQPCECYYLNEALNPCDPFQSCEILQEGCLVPDPNDIHNYFICSDTTDEIIGPVACSTEGGYYFDYDTHQCQEETEDYENPCKCNYTSDFDICNPFDFCQGNENCLIPDPSDCHNYYSCANINLPLSCPEGFDFDIETKYCTQSSNNCSNECIRNCAEKAGEVDVCGEPTNSCQKLGEDGYLCNVIDPSDCHNYFTCTELSDGSIVAGDIPETCPNGFYFNFTEQACIEENETCTRECTNYMCEYSCHSTNRNISDPTNCSNYFSCEDIENPTKRSCSDSAKYFNGIECTTNKYTCCASCVPYCPDTFIEVADPCNCKNYYFCQYEGVPSENMKFQCSEGMYFDISIGLCAEMTDEPCQNRCDDCSDLGI